jgi:uncharacterized protein YbaP (TraB family)
VQAQSLLWAIEHPELTERSFLYGTMHVTDARVFRFTDSLQAAFASVGAYAMEIKLDETEMAAAMLQFMTPEDAPGLDKLLKKKQYKLVAKVFDREMGVPLRMFNRFQPALIEMMVSQVAELGKEALASDTLRDALDLHLMQKAEAAGKKTYGLETVADQLRIFTEAPLSEQAQHLYETARAMEADFLAKKPKKKDQTFEKMLEAYVAGDLQTLMQMFEDEEVDKDLMDKLLYKRNITMTDRAIPLMQAQPTLIAVGAAHLPGPGGVIALLRERGYRVYPVVGTPQDDSELAQPFEKD